MDCETTPELLADDANAAVAAACWYWNSRKLNDLADADDIKSITRKINGGYNGLEDRQALCERAKQVLGIN
jgi:putative chitinase